MSAPAAHDTAAEQDPIEGVVKNMHIVLPVAGAVLIFMLAFIAVFMAGARLLGSFARELGHSPAPQGLF